jgi:hypothetical protein
MTQADRHRLNGRRDVLVAALAGEDEGVDG